MRLLKCNLILFFFTAPLPKGGATPFYLYFKYTNKG